MKRFIGAISMFGLALPGCVCCTPIDDCDVDSDCVFPERCDLEFRFCSADCEEASDDCVDGARCDLETNECVPEE